MNRQTELSAWRFSFEGKDLIESLHGF